MNRQQNAANSWMACSKTLHNLLEQYFSDTSTLSSFKQLFDKNNLQVKDGDVTEEFQEHLTSYAPPPLLHRPTKRSLEQSHVTMTSPDSKRFRPENYYVDEENPMRIIKETSNAREEMFEKTRSLGKPLGPPPPLLRQPPEEKYEREIRWGSLQKHYTKDKTPDPAAECRSSRNKGGHKTNTESLENMSRNARAPSHHFRQTESFKTKPSSLLSNGKKELLAVEPEPRQIKNADKSTCGGYAFDHMAMPKIVAVHSVSKGSEDEEEWAKNKKFISQAKANRNKLLHNGAPVEERRMGYLQGRTVTAQNHCNLVQGAHRQPETKQSTFANVGKSSSEEVSFERYVLYYLLSKFQGNVEQVKRVLKQNLLQEWLAYSQGNVDPRQLTFNGVNFYELRKLYEIWCQLQRNQGKNAAQSNASKSTSNIQNSEPNRVNTGSDTSFQRNQQICFQNSRCFPNSQHPKAASRLQRNYSPHNASSLNQGVPRTSVNPSGAPQKVCVIEDATRCGSTNNIPMHVQEKIYALSQNSTRETNRCTPTPAPHIHSQSSTNQHPAFNKNQATLNLKSDMCNIKGLPGDQAKANDFRLAQHIQENGSRGQYESYGHSPRRNAIERDRLTGKDISHTAVLQHLAQTASKQVQNQPLANATTPSSNSISRRNSYNHSAQSHQHLLEQAALSELRGKGVIRGQETKASYLWRFKGGKLISDNMPSINTGEPLTQMELDELVSGQRKDIEVRVSIEAKREVHTSGQQSYHKASVSLLSSEQSCNSQSNQPSVLTAEQQHKKVCGAAASGQRCYCVLDQKGYPQSTQKSNDPIKDMQRMINQTQQQPPIRRNDSPMQGQSSNSRMQTVRSISTHSTQVSQQTEHIIRSSSQDNQQFNANVRDSSNAQANQKSNASVQVLQENQQSSATRNARANQQSSTNLHFSSGQESNARFYASRAAQANQQFNNQTNQIFSRVSPIAQTKQHSSFQVSRNAQAKEQQSNCTFHVPRRAKEGQQSNASLHAQSSQQTSFHVSRNVEANQQPNGSLDSQKSDISLNARKNQQSNTSFTLPRTAQTHQQSNDSLKTSRNTPPSQKSTENCAMSETSKEVDKVATRVEKTAPPKRGRPRKTEASTVIKSVKLNDKNSSFLTSLPPKKQYTTLQQLAKKVIETRQRYEMENIPWKKKILKSLEGVLMKRLRKLEKETGEEADLGDEKSFETESDTTVQDNKT